MSKTIAELEVLWQSASETAKRDYLFQAVCHINRKIDDNKMVCVCRLKECSDALAVRVDGYKEKFVTRKQAIISLGVIFVVIVAMSYGAGMLSFNEAMGLIKP